MAINETLTGEITAPYPFMRSFGAMLPPDALVLDMGSWEGQTGNYLAQAGHRAISVELDFDAASRGSQLAKAIGESGVRNSFVCGDMLRPMLPDERFDAVVSTIALQCIPKTDGTTAIRGFQRLTKPGGLNVISAYIATPEQQRLKAGYNLYEPGQVKSLYTAEGWDILYDDEKLEDLKFEVDSSGKPKIWVSSTSQVIARKPQAEQVSREQLLKQAEYYRRSDPELSDHFAQLARASA